ncbi:hypothetical protein FGO68_gene5666 [Halteria grandinella]|uniref:Uncharacterized protein n=1 Tax=Halteria grandinella TaxID=5974 RepID=A0A8J8NND0_HALGN|nr:hypothetical protein FGO68_gene5666 [Halteria grandinella]
MSQRSEYFSVMLHVSTYDDKNKKKGWFTIVQRIHLNKIFDRYWQFNEKSFAKVILQVTLDDLSKYPIPIRTLVRYLAQVSYFSVQGIKSNNTEIKGLRAFNRWITDQKIFRKIEGKISIYFNPQDQRQTFQLRDNSAMTYSQGAIKLQIEKALYLVESYIPVRQKQSNLSDILDEIKKRQLGAQEKDILNEIQSLRWDEKYLSIKGESSQAQVRVEEQVPHRINSQSTIIRSNLAAGRQNPNRQ